MDDSSEDTFAALKKEYEKDVSLDKNSKRIKISGKDNKKHRHVEAEAPYINK